jgi:selenocysteine lyase/cysteine desulfurase
VKIVTIDETLWADLPDRQEAGSPNVVGAVALGVACDTLAEAGMDRVAAEESDLLASARERLAAVPGFEAYRVWDAAHPRVGLLTFNLAGIPYDLLAAVLSAEHGIGIRHGCFCAHPLMMRLLRVDDAEAHRLVEETRAGHHERLPGAARMSLGLASTWDDIEALATALESLASDGPRWTYAVNPHTDEYEPDPDPRPLPPLRVRLVDHPHGHGESA